jgi:hypothetical protein
MQLINCTIEFAVWNTKGPPQAPRDCVLANETWYSMNVRCSAGFDGGFRQTFHLLAYETELPLSATGSASSGSKYTGNNGGGYGSAGGHSIDRNRLFVLNLTNADQPEFYLNQLRSGLTYLLLIYAKNGKGSSSFQTLVGQTVAMLRQSSGTSQQTRSKSPNYEHISTT